MEAKKNALEIARENFRIWNDALQTRNSAIVDQLYREDCLFLPTFPEEGKETVGKDGVKYYFDHFLKKNPLGIIIDEKVEEKGKNVISYSGKYDFEVGPDDNREIVNAEYIFIWKKDENEWKIIFHYSYPIKNKE